MQGMTASLLAQYAGETRLVILVDEADYARPYVDTCCRPNTPGSQ
jgi:hypothetical protein